jgi:hypothetical protein
MGHTLDQASYMLLLAGAAAIGMGTLNLRAKAILSPQANYAVGLILIVTPLLLGATGGRWGIANAAAAAIVSVTAVFYGLASRNRLFVFLPSALLAILLMIESHASGGLAWAVFVVVLGLAVTVTAIALEHRRPAPKPDGELSEPMG